MGEETDIVEPISSEDIGAAKDLTANEPSKDHHRKRKKHLYKSLKELMEFYLGDINIGKDRFIHQSIQGQPFVYMDLATFLTFNKVRALTSNIEDLQKAIDKSDILQLSEDKTQVCRKTPITKKENEEECTIYVEQLGPDVEHDLLTKIFSEYGPVDYVSLPRFSHNGKCKGFAFVEFKDHQCAKKALEAFNAKGCCLSPQMAPEELLSIKNYDPKMENKKRDGEKKGIHHNELDLNKNKEGLNTDSDIDKNGDNIADSTDTNVRIKEEKKKRKCSDEFEKVHNKKPKKDNAQKDDEATEKDDNRENKCNNEAKALVSESSVNILNKKSKHKDMNDKRIVQSDCYKPVHEKEQEGKKRKRKCSEEIGDSNISNKSINEREGSKKNKKMNSSAVKDEDENQQSIGSNKKKLPETKEGTEPEESPSENEDENCSNKQKKKRKRKKKLKKDSSAMSLGLKILSKKEWKQLRNKYLNMQKKTMRSLKQHLSYSKWEKNKPDEKAAKLDYIKPGTVVKVTMDKPIADCKSAKSEMRVHPEIRYVDVTEGECYVYLRTSTPEVATALLQTNHWPNMEVLKDDEETNYWEKIKKDREMHFNKNKHNERGRTKLLKRAERYL